MGVSASKRVRWVRWGLCCALGVVGWGAVSTAAAQSKPNHAVTLSSYGQAVKARETFEAEPAGTHTKAEFGRVLDGFRAVYHADPADPHAADAMYAVAQLLEEQGRELNDAGSVTGATQQLAFLRARYPESRAAQRAAAALPPTHRSEAEVDAAPSSPGGGKKAEPAAQGLALTEENARIVEGSAASGKRTADADPSDQLRVPKDNRNKVDGNGEAERLEREVQEAASASAGRSARVPAPVNTGPSAATVAAQRVDRVATAGPMAVVTGIRHWSTPTYTRVAIDLGSEVTFQAARVPNPDRIYFDLHGAKLGPELVGKSFTVTDDGFLKRIRAAQAGPEVTRVVLDVNEVTEYSAFLLPNPYRLIIDIHGAKSREVEAGSSDQEIAMGAVSMSAPPPPPPPVGVADAARASAAANSSGLPAMAPTDGGAAARPLPGVWAGPKATADSSVALRNDNKDGLRSGNSEGNQNGRSLSDGPHVSESRHGAPVQATRPRPVPEAVATRSSAATATEVAAVSDAPGRVEATPLPTSGPIVSSVPVPKDVTLGAVPNNMGRRKKSKPALVPDDAAPAKAADKTADGQTSMIRALGLRIGRIVIDAGHGGHDSGTLGADGIEEKDVVLDVALRVGKLLHDRTGAEIIYTRSDDTFIPLETRTAIANKAQADLFLSIHANSSPDPSARGVETYYLNFTSDPTALDVAARENAVGGQGIHELSDMVKKIALKDKIAESREFATDVETSLYSGLARGQPGLKDRGVKKAPFVVLIGANMPSILAEISFVTNPTDADELRTPEYRERVAESLYAGVVKYEAGLAGARNGGPVVRADVR